MNGLSAMKRTASTSSSIFAVSSATTDLSAKQVMTSFPCSASFRGRAQRGARNDNEDTASIHYLPGDGFAAAVDERALVRPGHFDFFRRGPRRLFQRDGVLVRGQPIMPGAIERGKGFQFIERALLFEHLRVGLNRNRGIEHAGDAADRNFLGVR